MKGNITDQQPIGGQSFSEILVESGESLPTQKARLMLN
jgi:hypothetical protein